MKIIHFIIVLLFFLVSIKQGIALSTGCASMIYGDSIRKCMHSIYDTLESKETVYCECKFNSEKEIDCGTKDVSFTTIKKELSWEHVVPQSWSKENGDVNGEKANSDTLNLLPAIFDVNMGRLTHPYGEIDGEHRKYGKDCDFKLDKVRRLAEPRESIRGDIARIHFYMDKAHEWNIPSKEGYNKEDYMTVLENWAKEDVIDEAECKRVKISLGAQHEMYRKEKVKIAKEFWKDCFKQK